jgi:hypothetical protein
VADDLVAFLRARLDEDEAAAREATPGPWTVNGPIGDDAIYADDQGVCVVGGGRWGGEASVFDRDGDKRHIARHDPARVLAEVDAKRRILDLWSAAFQNPRDAAQFAGPDWDRVRDAARWTVRKLAAPYADHPDYREEWRP